jgi:hypothetical protein
VRQRAITAPIKHQLFHVTTPRDALVVAKLLALKSEKAGHARTGTERQYFLSIAANLLKVKKIIRFAAVLTGFLRLPRRGIWD